MSTSTDLLGDSCSDQSPQTTVLTDVSQVNGETPFVFSFDPADPIDSQATLTNAVLGQQVALLDIDSNESGTTAFFAVGPSGAFGTPKPGNINVAYSVGLLQAGGGGIAWHNFSSLEAGGAFPGVLDYDGAVSVDESGAVWIIGTTDDGSTQRAFVQYRQPNGTIGLTWVGDSGSRGKAIDVRDGHVMAGIDITQPYDVENGTITPSGPRDFVLLHFDAQTFINDAASPDWMYPDPGAAHDATGDDTIKQIELAELEGCGTVMYGLACLGGDCDAHDGGYALLMAFDPTGRSLYWGRAIEPSEGSLVPRQMAVVSDGIWIGAELKGTAFGQQSRMFGSGELAGASWFLKFPR
ncbi:MAG: hypothetical protein JNK04_21855 [Myxococcales bacterium]|nr:hypothetical protein [Myxococcales bacterium]